MDSVNHKSALKVDIAVCIPPDIHMLCYECYVMIFSTSPLPVMAAPDEAGLISTVVSYINTPHSCPASLPPTSSMPMISPRCKNRVLADCRGRPPSQPHWGFCRQVHRKILPKCVKNIHLCQKMLNGEQEMANTSKFWMHFWSNFPDLPVALLFII